MEIVDQIEAPQVDQQVPPDKPKKKLSEEGAGKLDKIVLKMVNNKESDDDIQMVVDDFVDLYGVEQQDPASAVPIDPPIPKPELKQTKLNAWEFPTVAPITLEEMDEVKRKRAEKSFKAEEVLVNAWKDSDEVTRDMLLHKMDMDEMNSPQQPMAIDNVATNQPYIPQALREADRKQKRESISSEEIKSVKDDVATHRAIIANTAIKYKKEGRKKEADELTAATYIKDAEDRYSPVVDKNAQEIAEGKLVYNVEKQEIYKPSSFGESIVHGYEQRTKAYHDGYKLALMSRDEQIKYLENQINTEYDPDKPIPVPGTIGEMIGSEGIATARSVGASLVAGFLTKNPAVASTVGAVASSDEYAMRSYYNEKLRTYAQVKRKLANEGVPEHEAQQIALDKSESNARFAATGDTIANVLMTASGLRGGARPLNIVFNKSVIDNAKKIIGAGIKFGVNTTKEGLTPAVIASGIQVAKNEASNAIGVKRDANEGVLESGATMLAFHGVVAAAAKAGGLASKGGSMLIRALAKKPIEITTKVTADLLEDHIIPPEKAEVLVEEVKAQQDFESQFPNVKEDAAIEKLQELTKEFDVNKDKLAKPEEGGVHETIQKSIKERQKEIEWEVDMLQAVPEDQIKILKAKQNELQTEIDAHDAAKSEGKAGKLEDRAAVKKQVTAIEKKLEEVQTRLDSPLYSAEKLLNEQIEKGELKGMLAEIAKENPEEVLKFVAEQAQGEVEMDGVMMSSREETVQQFGEKIVKIAEEMYPKPKPKHTVSQAGVRNIKLKEEVPVKMSYEDFHKGIIEQAAVVSDSSFDFRIDIPTMQMSDRIGAMKDIEAGKMTKRREKLESAIKEMYDSGTVPVTRGRGNHIERYDIPTNEWFGLDRKEQEAIAAEVPKLTDDDLYAIETEGITLENLHKFKHLFDGYPYTKEQYASIEGYFSAKSKSDAANQEGATRSPEPPKPTAAGPAAKPEPDSGEPPIATPPAEPLKASEPEYTTDIRHATLYEDAYGMGLKELEEHTGVSRDELSASADKLIKDGAAKDIIDRALSKKSVSVQEKAVLLKLKAAVDKEWEVVADEFDAAVKDGGGAAIHEAEIKKTEISARAQEIYQASRNAGSQYGLGLNSQKMSSGSNYSVGEMLTRKQEAKGSKLTKEEAGEVESKQRDIKKKEERIKDYGKKTADAIRKLRINKGDSAMSHVLGLPIAIYDTAITTIANAVELGANLADAIGQGVKYIKDNGGFKDKADEKKFRTQVMYAGTNEKRLSAHKQRLKSSIEKIKAKGEEGYVEIEKPPIELDKEAMDLRAELQKTKDNFELNVLKEQMKNRSVKAKITDVGRRLLATSGALTSTFDDSYTMVQAYVAMIANPKIGGKAWVEHWRQFGSEKRFRRSIAEMHNSSWWDTMDKSGLEILEPQSLSAEAKAKVEDTMIGSYHNEEINIKGVNVNPLQTVKPFERLFTSMGNIMRFELFKQQAQPMIDKGWTLASHPQEFKSLASAINSITGRGGMPEKVKLATPLIAPIMWSPSLFASSVNLLGISDLALAAIGKKGFYGKLTPTQRKFAAKQTATALSVGSLVLGGFYLAKMQGADVDADLDPSSVTFGNVRVGNKSYNVFGRFSGYAKIMTQTLFSRAVSKIKGDGWKPYRIKDGKKQFIDEGNTPYDPTTWSILGSFGRGKMRPTAGAVYDLIAGEHFYEPGKPYGLKDAALDVTTPISTEDVIKNLERDPIPLQMLSFGLLFEGLKVSDQRDFEKEGGTDVKKISSPKTKIKKIKKHS